MRLDWFNSRPRIVGATLAVAGACIGISLLLDVR
jgi:hypothetical protein